MTEQEKIKLLSDSKKTNEEISHLLGCSIVTVSRWRKKYNIIVPRGLKPGNNNKKRTKYKAVCQVCGIEFFTVPSSTKQKNCSRICMYKNESYLNKLKNMDKSYMQTEEYRKTLMKEDTTEYKRFRNRVTKLSEKIYEENKHILNPNNHVRTKCGVPGGYQLDHKLSVRTAFDNRMKPEDVSKLENLQLLPWKQNLLKR